MKKIITATIICSILLLGFYSAGALANEKQKLYIGFIGPLTGPAAYIGVDAMHGAEVAAWEVNQQGGFVVGDKKYLLEIVSYDDEMVAAKSVAGLGRLKDRYDISIAINNLSGTIMALLEKNEELNVLIGGFFQNPRATQVGNKLVLRHNEPMIEHNKTLARDAVKYYKPKTVAIMGDVSDFGRGISNVFSETLKELDIDVVSQMHFDQTKETDFRNQLTKIRFAKPDLIFVAGYDEANAAALNQGREMGINVPYVFTTGFQAKGWNLTTKERLEGCARYAGKEDLKPTPRGVTNYYENLYPKVAGIKGWKEEGGAYGGSIYQFVWTMILSMEKAGSIDPHKVREAALEVHPIPEANDPLGVSGFLENGDGIQLYEFAVFQGGELVVVK